MKYPIIYRVVATPSPFRETEVVRRLFCTKGRAERWAGRYLRKNPFGEALIQTKKRRGT